MKRRPEPRQKTINPAGSPTVTDVGKLRKIILALEAERDQARVDADRLAEALEVAADVATWMSGSDDFAPSGKAGKEWVIARERLFAAMNVLSAYRKAHGEAARQEVRE